MRRPTAAALTAFTALAVFGAACGSGTPAPEWASKVCGALLPWRTQITDLNTRAQQQISAASTPAQTREDLLRLVADAESATEQAHAAVIAAGTPDVDGGPDVARSFVASLEGARAAYGQARSDLQALPTSDATVFYDGVVAVMSRLTEEYGKAGVDTTALDSRELREAFDEVDQCQ